jgi:DNA-binding NarL/FixJ family response regulator
MSKKILIVDDSATARAMFRMCVPENTDYEIIQSGKWQDALQKAIDEKPFLVVLDYNMPEKLGSELGKLMQEQGVKAHFVLMTANTQRSVIKEVNDIGFSQVIEKPVSVEIMAKLLSDFE